MSDPEAHDITLRELEDARARVARIVHRTPVLSSATAGAWTTAATGVRLADDRLYLKAEHLQKTGSFKARGMTNRIATLGPKLRPEARSPCRPATPGRPTRGRGGRPGSR